MAYRTMYQTPELFSNIIINSDGENVTGLWFEGSRDSSKHRMNGEERDLEIFRETRCWLDMYFSGKAPDFMPRYQIANLTPFRQAVMDVMCTIPFGEVVTYGDIAKTIAKDRKKERMSAQAVGGAVGWNPICLMIPCHRVVGANGNLTGYGGGLQNKMALLAHEKNDMTKFFIPKQINAL